jgi:hypothetical protein
MKVSIVPLHTVAEDLVRDYLSRYGGMTSQLIDWKYFDSRFNRGRNRGMVWLRQNRIGGFIGLIPFVIRRGNEQRDMVWSCDWSVEDRNNNPGIGIMLLKSAIDSSGYMAAFGGNEASQRLLPQLATHTVKHAGLELVCRLRFGEFLMRAGQRFGIRPLTGHTPLHSLPIRRLPRTPGSRAVRTEPGVSRSIGTLLELSDGTHWQALHDWGYVDWQIGRCPRLVSWTCYIPDQPTARAAVVFWRRNDSQAYWRMALWAKPDASDDLTAVLRAAVRQIYDMSSFRISVVVSRLDNNHIHILENNGFSLLEERRTLFLYLSRSDREIVEELSHLSYLATDLAYRF